MSKELTDEEKGLNDPIYLALVAELGELVEQIEIEIKIKREKQRTRKEIEQSCVKQ